MRPLPNDIFTKKCQCQYIKPKKQSRQKNVKKVPQPPSPFLTRSFILASTSAAPKTPKNVILGKRTESSKTCNKMFKISFLQLPMKIGTNSSFYPIEHPLTDSPGDNFLKFFIIKFHLVNHSGGVERESEGDPSKFLL